MCLNTFKKGGPSLIRPRGKEEKGGASHKIGKERGGWEKRHGKKSGSSSTSIEGGKRKGLLQISRMNLKKGRKKEKKVLSVLRRRAEKKEKKNKKGGRRKKRRKGKKG